MKHFYDFHPIVIFIYYLTILLPSMFLMDGYLLCVSILAGIVWLGVINKKIPWDFIMLAIFCPMIMSVVNGLFVHNGTHELFFIAGKAITLESIRYGFLTGMMLVAVVIWFGSFNKIMGSEKIRIVFGRMRKTGLLIAMILRLVPEYIKRYKKVSEGINSNENNLKTRDGALRALSATFTWALENSGEMADSMEGRGYTAKGKWHPKQKWLLSDFLLLTIICMLQLLYLFSGVWKVSLFLILNIVPIIEEGKEELRWAIFKWKN